MADRKLRHLRRTDLIEIIYELQRSEARLQAENAALKRKLSKRDAEDLGGSAPEGRSRKPESRQVVNNGAVTDPEQIKAERKRLRRRRQWKKALATTIAALLVAAAAAVLIATLFLPMLQVSGTSMEPTLEEGDVIVLIKTDNFKTGQLVGIRYNGKVLLKRIIGGPGDWIDIDEDGNVSVNGEVLDEPYITDKSMGNTDLTYPCQVPDNSYFVLGDHRSVSVDSRNSAVGYIRKEQIIGRGVFRIWPLHRMSLI